MGVLEPFMEVIILTYFFSNDKLVDYLLDIFVDIFIGCTVQYYSYWMGVPVEYRSSPQEVTDMYPPIQ